MVASQEQVSCRLDSEAAILNLRNGAYYGILSAPVIGICSNNLERSPNFAAI